MTTHQPLTQLADAARVVITADKVEIFNFDRPVLKSGHGFTCRTAVHEAAAWAIRRLAEELEASTAFYRTGDWQRDHINMHEEDPTQPHSAISGMTPEQIERQVRIGIAATCCTSITFTEPGAIYDGAGSVMDGLEAEAVASSLSGVRYCGESIADVLLQAYEAEQVPEAEAPCAVCNGTGLEVEFGDADDADTVETPCHACAAAHAQPAPADTEQSGEAVPEGWQLVPVEPTDAMVDAAKFWRSAGIYRAMLAAAPRPAQQLPSVIEEIAAERRRQVEVEGWTPEHDDQHRDYTLAGAAGCYAMHTLAFPAGDPPPSWPWDKAWWKPSQDKRRNWIKSAALLVAAIEREDRAAAPQPLTCTCPSGDGSLRWPCPRHPPESA